MSCPRLTFAFHSSSCYLSMKSGFRELISTFQSHARVYFARQPVISLTPRSDEMNLIGWIHDCKTMARICQANREKRNVMSRDMYVCIYIYIYVCVYVYTVHVCACQGKNIIKCLVIFHLKNIHFNDQSCEELMTNHIFFFIESRHCRSAI